VGGEVDTGEQQFYDRRRNFAELPVITDSIQTLYWSIVNKSCLIYS
jgi:hypothetical protein